MFSENFDYMVFQKQIFGIENSQRTSSLLYAIELSTNEEGWTKNMFVHTEGEEEEEL